MHKPKPGHIDGFGINNALLEQLVFQEGLKSLTSAQLLMFQGLPSYNYMVCMLIRTSKQQI